MPDLRTEATGLVRFAANTAGLGWTPIQGSRPRSGARDGVISILTFQFDLAIIPPMPTISFQDIKRSLRQLYVEDERPWLVGFSGGKSLS